MALLLGVLAFFFATPLGDTFLIGDFFGEDFGVVFEGLFVLLGEGLDLVAGDITRSVGSFFMGDFALGDRLLEVDGLSLVLGDLLSAFVLLGDGVATFEGDEDVDGPDEVDG